MNNVKSRTYKARGAKGFYVFYARFIYSVERKTKQFSVYHRLALYMTNGKC